VFDPPGSAVPTSEDKLFVIACVAKKTWKGETTFLWKSISFLAFHKHHMNVKILLKVA
jgi:hypothetical protein